ncbi:hypothetical protein V2G26_009303 [Clonostachys chloroleuca]
MESPTIKIIGLALSLLFLRFLRDLPFRLPPQANLNTGSQDLGAFILIGVAPRSTLIQLCARLGPVVHMEPIIENSLGRSELFCLSMLQDQSIEKCSGTCVKRRVAYRCRTYILYAPWRLFAVSVVLIRF